MSIVVTAVRRVVGVVANVVDSIRHGEDDLREVYGDPTPPTGEQAALQGSVTLNLSQLGNGGMG